jgi:predicted SprT family Zn-dependent metalloprotease
MADELMGSGEDSFDVRRNMIEGLILDQSTHIWSPRNTLDLSMKSSIVCLMRLSTRLARQTFYSSRLQDNSVAWYSMLMSRLSRDGQLFICPPYLDEPLEQIRATIAHELAHVFLHHSESPCESVAEVAEKQEKEAVEVVKKWGFTIPHILQKSLKPSKVQWMSASTCQSPLASETRSAQALISSLRLGIKPFAPFQTVYSSLVRMHIYHGMLPCTCIECVGTDFA